MLRVQGWRVVWCGHGPGLLWEAGARREVLDHHAEVELGAPVTKVRFGREEIEQARALGAVHGENWEAVIVGSDVAGQLAGDWIARCVKTQRANQRRNANATERDDRTGERPPADADPHAGDSHAAEAQRAQRQAEREAKEQATRFNAELGRAIFVAFGRVKVDERTLKLLSCVNVCGELGELAMRGARYGFPGWVQEQTQKNGKTKLTYIDQRTDAARKAAAYLSGATSPGELVGRQLALAAMGVYADQDAVAQSSRCWHEVKPSGPWAGEFDALLDELVAEKLPPVPLGLLEPVLAKRRQQRQHDNAQRQAEQQTLARLDGVEDRIAQLDEQQLAAVERDLDASPIRFTTRASQIRKQLDARRAELATAQHSSD